MDERTGRTTDQMEQAPYGAHFIWCNHNLTYPLNLAQKHGRGDLQIFPPSTLEHPERYRGTHLTGLVIDHATILTKDQQKGLELIMTRVIPGLAEIKQAEMKAPGEKRAAWITLEVDRYAQALARPQSVDLEKEAFRKGYLAALHDARRVAHYLDVTAVLHSSEWRDQRILRAVETEIARLKTKVGVPPAIVT